MTEQPHVERPLAPNTTTQEDLTTSGQRRINLIWETTQALLATTVTITSMVVCLYTVVPGGPFPEVLSLSFGLIIGFYFGRTNHAAIGGTGHKPVSAYEGR